MPQKNAGAIQPKHSGSRSNGCSGLGIMVVD